MKHDKKIQNKGIKTISLLNYASSSSSILLFSLLLNSMFLARKMNCYLQKV